MSEWQSSEARAGRGGRRARWKGGSGSGQSPQRAVPKVTCPCCLSQQLSGARLCGDCGAQLPKSQAPAAQPRAPQAQVQAGNGQAEQGRIAPPEAPVIAAQGAPPSMAHEAPGLEEQLQQAYALFSAAAAFYQVGALQKFPEEVLAPIRALAMEEKARWENLRPLPVQAAAAQDHANIVQGQVASHGEHMRCLQNQLGLAEAENVRLQAELATAIRDLRVLEGLHVRAQAPPPADPGPDPEAGGATAPPTQALAVVNQWMAQAFIDPRGQQAAIASVAGTLVTILHAAQAAANLAAVLPSPTQPYPTPVVPIPLVMPSEAPAARADQDRLAPSREPDPEAKKPRCGERDLQTME